MVLCLYVQLKLNVLFNRKLCSTYHVVTQKTFPIQFPFPTICLCPLSPVPRAKTYSTDSFLRGTYEWLKRICGIHQFCHSWNFKKYFLSKRISRVVQTLIWIHSEIRHSNLYNLLFNSFLQNSLTLSQSLYAGLRPASSSVAPDTWHL